VSIPETGLEDARYGWLDGCQEQIRTAGAVISQAATKLIPRKPTPPPRDGGTPSLTDSGIDSGEGQGGAPQDRPASKISHTDQENSQWKDKEVPAQPGTGTTDELPKQKNGQVLGGAAHEGNQETRPQEQSPRKRDEQAGEKSPRKQVREENEETRVGAQEILPRKRDERVPDDERLPRKQSAQILGDIARPDADQSLPRQEIEETRPQEPSHRERDERVPDDNRLPRRQSTQILGDVARPDVDQSLPRPGSEDPSNIKRDPRKLKD